MARKHPSAPAAVETAVATPEAGPANGGDTAATAKGSPPVWRKRLFSNGSFVECAVFGHAVDAGQASFTAYSAALRRSYKDADGAWKDTRSLRADDLLVAAHLLQRAYAWISEQEQQRL